LRELAIAKNDAWWESDKERTAWALDLVPQLLGTRDEARDVRRAAAIARYTVRVIAAEALRSAELLEEADRLASLPEDVRLDVAEAAARTARTAATDAWTERASWDTWAAMATRAAEAASKSAVDAAQAVRAVRVAEATAEDAENELSVTWAVRAARAAAESAIGATRAAKYATQAIARDSTGLDDLLRVAMETE